METMAKRFTDTEKWKKPFIRGLKTPYKLLWLYILDECDHAGVWQVDFDVAQIKIGEKLDYNEAYEQLKSKVQPFDDNQKWFISDFINFQYGKLNPDNRAHQSVLLILERYKLTHIFKELVSPLQDPMDKEKDKDKLREGFDKIWETYQKKVGDKTKIFNKWCKLTDADRQAIFLHVPTYVTATPDKKYRKNFETYLNNKCWNDEVIVNASASNQLGYTLQHTDRTRPPSEKI